MIGHRYLDRLAYHPYHSVMMNATVAVNCVQVMWMLLGNGRLHSGHARAVTMVFADATTIVRPNGRLVAEQQCHLSKLVHRSFGLATDSMMLVMVVAVYVIVKCS